MLRIETGLVLLCVLIAFTYPRLGSRWFENVERRFSRLSRRRAVSVALVGVIALVLRAAVLPIEPIPEPIVHDEFGYLLAADTFAHGRLTNPTHPMWQHFESFSILQKPTYQCFAQPAQGMILAFGKVVFGHPFWGVWLSIGLMGASITWMLQGWLPPDWALLGGMLAILRYGVFGYWANSYWGGAAGAIGGALVLGALPRMKSSQRVRDALVMGLGLAILANSRPYEGFVFSLPIAVLLIAWVFGKNRPPFSVAARSVLLPLALMLALTAAGLGYYFWRVTGSPSRMPYQVEHETYAVIPYVIWQHPQPEPLYHHPVFKKMYVDEGRLADQIFWSPAGIALKMFWAWKFYFGPLFMLPFIMLFPALPYGFGWKQMSSNVRFLAIVLAVLTGGLLLSTFYVAHYSAPAMGIVLALLLSAARRVSHWRIAMKPTGLFIARCVPVIAIIMFVLRAAAGPLHIPLQEAISPSFSEQGFSSFGRSAVQTKLQQLPGQHLVIVRYRPEHKPFFEWVYNDADINASKVVWAREMDSPENELLIRYFKGRQVWLLEADEKPARLSPYAAHAAAGDPGP
jgi:hypothetical protein